MRRSPVQPPCRGPVFLPCCSLKRMLSVLVARAQLLCVVMPFAHLSIYGVERIRGRRQEATPPVVAGAALHFHHGDRLARQAAEEVRQHSGRKEAHRCLGTAGIGFRQSTESTTSAALPIGATLTAPQPIA